jgi:hypothetical protein
MHPRSATSVAFEQLLARLDVEHDEVAVASVAATRSPDSGGVWQLVYGSLLFGVQEMAATSWLGWRSHTDVAAASTLARMLSVTAPHEPDLAKFTFQESEWLMARLVLSSRQGQAIDTAAAFLKNYVDGVSHWPTPPAVLTLSKRSWRQPTPWCWDAAMTTLGCSF